MSVAVIVPVLGRPERVQPLKESLVASEQAAILNLWFVCTPGDTEQIEACQAFEDSRTEVLIAPWPRVRGDYARKINLGLWESDDEYVFCGADDLRFEPGWADAAITVTLEQDVCFVATNDLGNAKVKAGQHATHPLVCRDYAEECGTIDAPGLIYHEGYWHTHVDNEATGTAKYRDCFGFAKDAIVEHLHPIWGKSKRDATYDLGDSMHADDRLLLKSREWMWGGK